MRIFKDSSLIEEIQDLDLGIVSAGESKQFDFSNKIELLGSKLIKTDSKYNIKGKKDITNILIALDIFD
jgi:hypothetical protein